MLFQSDADLPAIANGNHLLSMISYNQFKSVLHYLLDESEFLAPFGIRSLSKVSFAKCWHKVLRTCLAQVLVPFA